MDENSVIESIPMPVDKFEDIISVSNNQAIRKVYAEIIGEISYHIWIDLISDYYTDMIEEFEEDVKYWNYDSIYNSLIVEKYEGATIVAEMLFNIGNNSTFNDILVDSSFGRLNVRKLARAIVANV
ncbi:MAG: hypothetical protein EBU66_13525 [Bacteroidetes bacterium]|nr:hypothetical protein [bacterium]NBP65666.1 hypothetical protein [Bacteroidota bacterium]